MEYVIEMLNITKEFPGIKANDNITVQLKKGEIHALLGVLPSFHCMVKPQRIQKIATNDCRIH